MTQRNEIELLRLPTEMLQGLIGKNLAAWRFFENEEDHGGGDELILDFTDGTQLRVFGMSTGATEWGWLGFSSLPSDR